MDRYAKAKAKAVSKTVGTVSEAGKNSTVVKYAAKLATSVKERKQAGLFCVEGVRLCEEALRSGCRIKSFFYTEKAAKEYADSVRQISEAADEVRITSEDTFRKLSDTVSPQGMFAVLVKPTLKTANIDRHGRYIALENAQDPSNLGAIARTAEALGIDGIIVSGSGCDPYSPKAQRSAMGSLIRLPVIVTENFLDTMSGLKAEGMSIVAAVVRGADEYLGETVLGRGTAVMIGNEGNGLTDDAIKLANKRVGIKMTGKSESLNAAAAAALFIWEMTGAAQNGKQSR